jgi:hypothetical protein
MLYLWGIVLFLENRFVAIFRPFFKCCYVTLTKGGTSLNTRDPRAPSAHNKMTT